jgi:hypothetical protein
VYLPTTPPAVNLLGARISPSPHAAAAFLIYASERKLVGLLVQSLDAPMMSTPRVVAADGRDAVVWTSGGQGFALVGDLDPASLLKIASAFFDPAQEPDHVIPERGS